MKRLYYLLLLLPLLGFMASCSDDDKDLPKVSISIDYTGGTDQDGTIVIAQGQTLTINAINVTPAEGTKKALLGNTTYAMDGVPFYTIGVAPYGCEIDTSDLTVGPHALSFYSQVFQEDKTPGFALYGININVTEPVSDPDDGSGTVTPDVTVSDTQK